MFDMRGAGHGIEHRVTRIAECRAQHLRGSGYSVVDLRRDRRHRGANQGGTRMNLPDRFAPHEDASQPRVPVEGYPNTVKRSPTRAAIPRPFTRTDITGPLDLSAKLKPGDVNLAVVDGRPAQGSLIHVSGRVLDEDGRPVRGAIVEMWQANAGGRYFHPNDQRDAPSRAEFRALVAPAAHSFLGAGAGHALAPGDADVFPGRSAERL